MREPHYDGNVTLEQEWTESAATDASGCATFSATDDWTEVTICDWLTEVIYAPTYKPNDGVVLAESAMNYPGVNHIDVMQGSNHQQMRNDSNTKDKLNGLWNGAYGDFFITQAR